MPMGLALGRQELEHPGEERLCGRRCRRVRASGWRLRADDLPPACRARPPRRRAGRARRGTGTPARGGSRRSRRARRASAPNCVEPGGEALVQLGARHLRERLVGGVADQQVPEPVRLVVGDDRRLGPNEVLANEGDRGGRRASAPRARAPRPRRDGTPGPRPPHARARRARQGRAGRAGRRAAPGSWAAPRRRRRPRRTIATISSTKSGFPPAASRIRSRSSCAIPSRERLDQLAGVLGRERLEQDVGRVQLAAAPGRPRVEQLRAGPCRGAGSARRGSGRRRARRGRGRSDSPQCMSSKTITSGRSDGPRLEQLAKGPGDLLGRARGRRRRPGPRPAARRSPVPSETSCFTTSVTGQ